MAWVNVRGRRYYRRSRRVGGRVVTEHVGRGPAAEAAAALDAVRRAKSVLDRVERAGAVERLLAGFRAVFRFDRAVADLMAAAAPRFGFHRHRRQWRRLRGFAVPTPPAPPALRDLARRLDRPVRAKTPPLLPPDLGRVPEADRAVLRAADGDADALRRAQAYLADPATGRAWGDAMLAARAHLVAQISGDDLLVGAAVAEELRRMAAELGWADATPLERLAVVRVQHAWLAVAALEAEAQRWPAAGRERGRVERVLGQAERRLQGAMAALAFFRPQTVAAGRPSLLCLPPPA